MFEEKNAVDKELMLVKVKYNRNNRRDIMEICELGGATIVDYSNNQMILQVCDTPEKTAQFIKMLKGISIVEVARTGALALQKCIDNE